MAAAHGLALLLLLCGIASYLIGRGQPAGAQTVSTATPAAAAASTPTPTDPIVYARVRQLREKLALTDADLGAMGCTQAQATSVLSALTSWYQANASNWDAAEAGMLSAHRQLDAAVRSVNVGPRDEGILGRMPTYTAGVTAAEASFDQLTQGAATNAAAGLTYAQQQTCAAAKANGTAGVPDLLRYAPNVNAAEARLLARAMARGGGGVAPATLAALVPFAQQQAISTARANQQACMDGVLAAEQAVLPPPAATASATGG